jgi:diguanylate cyclase (GGDEF)-like protein
MSPVSEYLQDKSLRTRLIFACLGVSAFVSIIYVLVSYRLTAELVTKTELSAMELQLAHIHAELLREPDLLSSDGNQHAISWVAEEHDNEPFYLEVTALNTNQSTQWHTSQKLKQNEIEELLRAISLTKPEQSGVVDLEQFSYLWFQYSGSQFQIKLIKATTALDLTMVYVAKRLSFVSVIVLWLATWLALTMSSIIAKRVQFKNDQLARIATHDVLTGLPNRLYLEESLEQDLGGIQKSVNQHTQGCLLVIDLDKFKEVNDSFGHSSGDFLLKEVAKRLSQSMQNKELLVRAGGDEFIIWALGATIIDAQSLAQRIVAICNKSVLIHNLAVNIGASIGIAHFPSHANSSEELIINADTAMYKAKQHRFGWHLFDNVNTADYKNRLRLRADLSMALKLRQIKLYYQPKLALASREVTGVEALARWHHPTKGYLSPDHFIELIEQSGRIQEFGRYIISAAIEQLAMWREVGITTPIAVNLSPYNLLDPALVDFIKDQLAIHNVSADLLEFELTENATSLNIELIEAMIKAINDIGIVLAIDDFGTGMSSLSYIANLNVDVIKIDRTFVLDIVDNPKHKAIVSATITLSHFLECKMVAEGIEDEEQALLLESMGCEFGQGYLFSKPLPTEEMTAFLLSQTNS